MSWPIEYGRLEAGEILLLNSDGVSEARDFAGQDFGDARIESTVRGMARGVRSLPSSTSRSALITSP